MEVTYENYFLSSSGVWYPITETPNDTPNFTSYKEEEPTSFYWYGEDENGKFIIRKSQHWRVVSRCRWDIIEKGFVLVNISNRGWTSWCYSLVTHEIIWVTAKIYLNMLKIR